MYTLTCEQCSTRFKSGYLVCKGSKRRFCSRKCKTASYGKKFCPGCGVEKHGRPRVYKFCSKACAIKHAFVGKNSPNWKGDDVSYQGIHAWVRKNFVQNGGCSKCGSFERLEWANKDWKYSRERKSWFRLCHKCHAVFDAKIRKRKIKNGEIQVKIRTHCKFGHLLQQGKKQRFCLICQRKQKLEWYYQNKHRLSKRKKFG